MAWFFPLCLLSPNIDFVPTLFQSLCQVLRRRCETLSLHLVHKQINATQCHEGWILEVEGTLGAWREGGKGVPGWQAAQAKLRRHAGVGGQGNDSMTRAWDRVSLARAKTKQAAFRHMAMSARAWAVDLGACGLFTWLCPGSFHRNSPERHWNAPCLSTCGDKGRESIHCWDGISTFQSLQSDWHKVGFVSGQRCPQDPPGWLCASCPETESCPHCLAVQEDRRISRPTASTSPPAPEERNSHPGSYQAPQEAAMVLLCGPSTPARSWRENNMSLSYSTQNWMAGP